MFYSEERNRLKEKINKRICGVVLGDISLEDYQDLDICWVGVNQITDNFEIFIDCKYKYKYFLKHYKLLQRVIRYDSTEIKIDKLFPRDELVNYINVPNLALACAPLIAGEAKAIILFHETDDIQKSFKEYYLRYANLFNWVPDIYNCSTLEIDNVRQIDTAQARQLMEGQTLDIDRGEGWHLI